MKIKVLGCSGSEAPGHRSPAFLIDDVLLLDAGSIGSLLPQSVQEEITHVLLTHAHHDHIRGLPSFADNLVVAGQKRPVQIIGSEFTLHTLQKHLINGVVWPDFSRIPAATPILRWQPVEPETPFTVRDYRVTAFSVNHSIPSLAYQLQCHDVTLLYTGDMGPTPQLWKAVAPPTSLIVEVSFPNALKEMAHITGHLTASLLAKELSMLPKLPKQILVSHLKPLYADEIRRELATLEIPGLAILANDQEFSL